MKFTFLIMIALGFSAQAFAADLETIYEGECMVHTSGPSGADAHILSRAQVVLVNGQSVELFRTNKAIYKVSAHELTPGTKPISGLSLYMIHPKTGKIILSAGTDWYSDSTPPPSVRLVGPNFTEVAGPKWSQISCMQTVK